MSRRCIAGLCLLGLVLPGAMADEKPSSALKRVVKATLKAGSYRLDTSVRGGLAQGADHQITSSIVYQSYATEHVKSVVHFTAPFEGFQVAGNDGGASLQDGQWRTLNGCDEGRQANKLFQPLEVVLAKVLKLKRTAEWVDDGSSAQAPAPSDATLADDEIVVQRHLRVLGPTKIAVQHFSEVQQSGCFGGG